MANNYDKPIKYCLTCKKELTGSVLGQDFYVERYLGSLEVAACKSSFLLTSKSNYIKNIYIKQFKHLFLYLYNQEIT